MDDVKEQLLHPTVESPSREMGMGSLGDPTIIFVRKFRWTLGATNLDEHFIKKVKMNLARQTLEIEAMEVIFKDDTDIGLHKWLESDLAGEELVFTTYDGCGGPLYEYRFSGLTLVSDEFDFDYASSDESSRKIQLQYTQSKRKFLKFKEPEQSPVKKRFNWTLRVSGSMEEHKIKISSRPTLTVEETEINFLNAKSWIPGKAEWQSLTLIVEPHHVKKIVGALVNPTAQPIHLSLYTYDMSKKLEEWTLTEFSSTLVDRVDEQYEVTVKFKNVSYTCVEKK